MHNDNLRSFLIKKGSWSIQIFDDIDWNSSKRALRRLSKNRQMNVVKLCHNYWHTGSRHVQFYGGYWPWCFCQETKEDWRHILNCLSLDVSYHRDASWQKLKKDMQMWRLPADFWTDIEKGLHHLTSYLNESTSPTLPFQISANPIRNHLRVAFQEQNLIKWTNLLKGRMSHRWQQFATAHVQSKKLDLRAQEWGPKFITFFWDHSLRIWHFCKWRLPRRRKHTRQTLQTRRTRKEKNAQIWKRYIELQPILHLFQQKHFESPDTVNNLRYDSQKCWTAHAKLFLDEDASRSPSTDNELLPRYLTSRAGIG
jgi:hypothetical protein